HPVSPVDRRRIRARAVFPLEGDIRFEMGRSGARRPVELRRKSYMARIAGVNLPTNKRVVIALQYIHGIGPAKAQEITTKLSIAPERRVQDLTDQEVLHI